MKSTLDRKPRILVWSKNDFATAPDGVQYAIFDDWSRGEPRMYWPSVTTPDENGNPTGWKKVALMTHSKVTAMNAAERHARRHHATRVPA